MKNIFRLRLPQQLHIPTHVEVLIADTDNKKYMVDHDLISSRGMCKVLPAMDAD
jgi:hypothetical protein